MVKLYDNNFDYHLLKLFLCVWKKNLCFDKDKEELISELIALDPALQRNIGITTDIKNLRLLAQAIETGELQAISDAYIGTRARAAHSYIIMTKMNSAF